MSERMTPLERVLTALAHKEADRVPFFLLTTLQGARETGTTIKEYYSKAANVVEGQFRLMEKYGSDCLFSLFYAAIEAEAWGGETIFVDDGPPNAGEPPVRGVDAVLRLEPPRVAESPGLLKVLEAIRGMKERIGGKALIMGVAVSPFSLPVMQLGFDSYLELMYSRDDAMERLMKANEEFCVEWANAQIDAGATAICYFDPISSPTMVPKDLYLKYGYPVSKRVISRLKGPAAIHFASGRCLPILEEAADTGVVAIGVSAIEDLSALKAASRGRISLVGNLNAVEMRRWTPAQAEAEVKKAIAAAGSGGGFILSDNHGEIPWQVPDATLFAISEAVRKWGPYPLSWIGGLHGR